MTYEEFINRHYAAFKKFKEKLIADYPEYRKYAEAVEPLKGEHLNSIYNLFPDGQIKMANDERYLDAVGVLFTGNPGKDSPFKETTINVFYNNPYTDFLSLENGHSTGKSFKNAYLYADFKRDKNGKTDLQVSVITDMISIEPNFNGKPFHNVFVISINDFQPSPDRQDRFQKMFFEIVKRISKMSEQELDKFIYKQLDPNVSLYNRTVINYLFSEAELLSFGVKPFKIYNPDEQNKTQQPIEKKNEDVQQSTEEESKENEESRIDKLIAEAKEPTDRIGNDPSSLDLLSEQEQKEVQALKGLEEAGLSLSDEQRNRLEELYAKTRREQEREQKQAEFIAHFDEYRAKEPERTAHREAEMAARREANKEKMNRRERRLAERQAKIEKEKAELERMKKEALALSQMKMIAPELLTEEQKQLLTNDNMYIVANDIAEEHANEEGMNQEVAKLMAEYYEKQGGERKPRR